ncbi:MAG: Lsr2 family protein [Actinomycetota bacterium]|nr:Lsr2 family protein [Actinomycetota bacterium]
MAQKVVTRLEDDIDGSEAAETVTFGLDGKQYQIDLNEEHAGDLREVLAPFISVARPLGGAGGGRKARAAAPQQRTSTEVDSKAVRVWAEANGIKVSPRGRLSADVVEQYRAAGN